MSDTFTATVETELRVTIHDRDAVDRVILNLDDEGNPQPVGSEGGKGWQDYYYRMSSEEEVIEMFAYNYAVNGVRDVSRLDGWADLDSDAVSFELVDVHTEARVAS